MFKSFEELHPEAIRQILEGKNPEAVSADVLQYVYELDTAAKYFKGSVTGAAGHLKEKYPHLSFRTARERVYDAIRYLHAGEKGLPAKHWYSYYADRYEELAAVYSRSPQTVRHAKACFDAALECRLKVSETGLPEEFMKIRMQLVSPDVPVERLSIREFNLKTAFSEGLKLIDSFDISEPDRKRIIGEFGTELGVEDAETVKEVEDAETVKENEEQ
jgi:hypothetical protein